MVRCCRSALRLLLRRWRLAGEDLVGWFPTVRPRLLSDTAPSRRLGGAVVVVRPALGRRIPVAPTVLPALAKTG
ncbi:unnamed protein product [Ectocarpus sp. CCAP 1310/34]|nr:unnamed protein product [Ectocarpus sp. CCAP 1310/34]